MKRVVILSAFLSPFRSGAEACAEEVALRLCDQFDITIVTAKLRPDLPRHDRLQGKVAVVRVGLGLSIDKWLYPFLAPFAARRLRPDVVHAVLETFAGLALLFCKAVVPSAKRVLTLQTTNSNFLRGPILHAAQHVTAISSVLVEIAKKLGIQTIELIPNGIDMNAIRSVCERHNKVYGRILFVGRLEPMKGVDTLLRSVALLPKETVWHLHVVGDGSQRKTLEALAARLGFGERVTFVGRLLNENLWKEYAEAEIFCGLSRSEALGNVFLEAQAAGCAVVATNVGGIPDVVLNGKTGILVAPDAPEDACSAIENLLRDSGFRARLAEAAITNAAVYDWGSAARKYANIYA